MLIRIGNPARKKRRYRMMNNDLNYIKHDYVIIHLDSIANIPGYLVDKMAVKKSDQQKYDFVHAYRSNKQRNRLLFMEVLF